VQVIDSGPDRKYSAISYLFAHAFALARERIWITSPYFIPSAAVEESLIAAALRGIDLRILVPLKPDSRVAMLAASSYFGPLLEAGARIFRYRRGFVHAKTVVVDDWVGTVGSANMDIRSFLLNYEVNAFVYGKEFCDKLAAQFALDLESAIEVKLESELHLAFSKRLLRSAARMMSPLL
jgi:cardiolipin synthase